MKSVYKTLESLKAAYFNDTFEGDEYDLQKEMAYYLPENERVDWDETSPLIDVWNKELGID
jgi:hypothetical protein